MGHTGHRPIAEKRRSLSPSFLLSRHGRPFGWRDAVLSAPDIGKHSYGAGKPADLATDHDELEGTVSKTNRFFSNATAGKETYCLRRIMVLLRLLRLRCLLPWFGRPLLDRRLKRRRWTPSAFQPLCSRFSDPVVLWLVRLSNVSRPFSNKLLR